MKKAILTIGLFSLVMVLTSFTTPETSNNTKVDNNTNLNIIGQGSVKNDVKVDIIGQGSVKNDVKVD
jgi:hypothetical protein